jgi:hypothetical protein
MSAAFRVARNARLVATGYFRANSRRVYTMQQKYCDHSRHRASNWGIWGVGSTRWGGPQCCNRVGARRRPRGARA